MAIDYMSFEKQKQKTMFSENFADAHIDRKWHQKPIKGFCVTIRTHQYPAHRRVYRMQTSLREAYNPNERSEANSVRNLICLRCGAFLHLQHRLSRLFIQFPFMS